MEEKHITLPLTAGVSKELHAGDYVYISGIIYSARDAAHKRMYDAIHAAGEDAVLKMNATELFEAGILPLDLTDQTIYYLGPTPAREGKVIGSAGPTTASRMDKYTPLLLKKGLRGMIGKGKRSEDVRNAIVENGCVYFAATGGAGALLSKCIKESEVLAYDDLGTEAIRKMRVENFPAIVIMDTEGNNLYETAVEAYNQTKA